jgi:hypothetical protein
MVSARWLPNRPAWWYPSWSRVTSLLTPVCFFVTLMDGQYWRSTVGSFCCYKSEEYWMRLHQHPTTILRNIVFKAPYFCCCSLLEHFRYSLFFVTPTIWSVHGLLLLLFGPQHCITFDPVPPSLNDTPVYNFECT